MAAIEPVTGLASGRSAGSPGSFFDVATVGGFARAAASATLLLAGAGGLSGSFRRAGSGSPVPRHKSFVKLRACGSPSSGSSVHSVRASLRGSRSSFRQLRISRPIWARSPGVASKRRTSKLAAVAAAGILTAGRERARSAPP
ncbi:MAG: hypothetical protein AB7I59_09795 [Geminicoccaceae bacterium]